MKRPSPSFMMLALCTAVTVLRLFSSAYSKAYCAVRRDFTAVMTFKLSTTPGTTSCSKPLYSPSVFSLQGIGQSQFQGRNEGIRYFHRKQQVNHPLHRKGLYLRSF